MGSFQQSSGEFLLGTKRSKIAGEDGRPELGCNKYLCWFKRSMNSGLTADSMRHRKWGLSSAEEQK